MKLPNHIPQLDVLRGVAVLEVMLYHAVDIAPSLHLNPAMRAGYTGVDLFFVLSGFLITGILIRSKDEAHYFKNFYARRALRIWPLYYALLLFTFLLLPAVAPSLREAIFEGSRPWPSFFFFIQNLMVSHPPFDTLRVTWSLAIEEQFYLAWPLIVWLAPTKNAQAAGDIGAAAFDGGSMVVDRRPDASAECLHEHSDPSRRTGSGGVPCAVDT